VHPHLDSGDSFAPGSVEALVNGFVPVQSASCACCAKVLRGFGLAWAHVVAGSVEPNVVDLVEPGQHCEPNVIEGLP
jgi:hypothetical protein